EGAEGAGGLVGEQCGVAPEGGRLAPGNGDGILHVFTGRADELWQRRVQGAAGAARRWWGGRQTGKQGRGTQAAILFDLGAAGDEVLTGARLQTREAARGLFKV